MGELAASRIRVAVGDSEADGLLVSSAGVLVAVLTCLDDPSYGANQGRWYLEAGFGRCAVSSRIFDDREIVLRWTAERLGLAEDSALAALTELKANFESSST